MLLFPTRQQFVQLLHFGSLDVQLAAQSHHLVLQHLLPLHLKNDTFLEA